MFSGGKNPNAKDLKDKQQQATNKLSGQAQADAKKKQELANKQTNSKVPANALKDKRKNSTGKVADAGGKKPTSADAAAKNKKTTKNTLAGDPRTKDIASKSRSTLTGKDRDQLGRILRDPNASPELKKAARDALRQDRDVKRGLDMAFHDRIHHGGHHPGHDFDPFHHHGHHDHHWDPFHHHGHYFEPIDFGGLFGGIATVISVMGGGGDVVVLPPPFVDQGYAIFEPCVPVEGGMITAQNFDGLSGVYYSVDDPVVEGAEAEVATQADNDLAYAQEVAVTPTTASFQTRYLLIGNSSEEKITVHVQYLTQDQEGNWIWPGGDSETPGRVVSYELEPGQSGYAYDGDWQIHACRARVWAESESGKLWETHKETDFVLVAETDSDNNPLYVASQMGTAKWVAK